MPKKDSTNFGSKRNTNGFDKNPQNINRKGQPKIRPLRDMLNAISENHDELIVPLDQCEIDEKKGEVKIKIPSKEKIAISLQKRASKDHRWFAEWAKVMGEYAPAKTQEIDEVIISFID